MVTLFLTAIGACTERPDPLEKALDAVGGREPVILAGLGLGVVVESRLSASLDHPPDLPVVEWNDNLVPAGTIAGDVLDLRLEVIRGMWKLLGDEHAGVEILAFREDDSAPQNPGPMIRVPEGTEIRVSVGNPLEVALVVHGLSARKLGVMDSLVVPPGAAREARFVADAPGTYFYWATTTGTDLRGRAYEDSQLNGALVIDPAATEPVGGAGDRVMLLSMWFAGPDEEGEPDFGSEFLAINGRPWPHTERLTYDLGDTVRWRLINASRGTHPMHLHGFFFEVEARGDIAHDTLYWPSDRRQAVTERLARGTTATIVWSPDRPGGWIFHCHNSFHVVSNAIPPNWLSGHERDEELIRGHSDGDPHRHVLEQMGGLMMGIYVRPPEGWTPREPKRRELRLFIQSDSVPGERRRFGYVLQEGEREPPPDSVPAPSSTIVVWQGEPTSVTAINRTAEPTQIHWHGLEIESYYDGVTGVGGYPGNITPAIMPGDSFEMRITPPRAGSYMYHTHVNDIRQQSAGLYGAFIVLEPDEVWSPGQDRVILFSTGSDPDLSVLINGSRTPEPMRLRVGEQVRLRFMNITLFNGSLRVRLVREGYPESWRALAKDGADLPPHQQEETRAEQTVSVGETYDYAYTPDQPGQLRIEGRDSDGELLIEQVVVVEE